MPLVQEKTEPHQEWMGLISRTAKGDQAALGSLYDQSSPQVYGLILRIVGDHHTAEEVTLDVYTQVWRQAHTYDQHRGTPTGWLFTLARTRAIDRIRSGQVERNHQVSLDGFELLPSDGRDPEATVFDRQRQRRVQQALAGLNPDQREALVLAYFSGLSQTEIAAKLNVPLGTIKTRMRLGMMKLRDLLGAEQQGGSL